MDYNLFSLVILLLPILSFVLLAVWGKKFQPRIAGIIGTLSLVIITVLSFVVAYGYFFEFGKLNDVYIKHLCFNYEWLRFTDNLAITIGIVLDPISVMMLLVISIISCMVHIYSLQYMQGEERYATYYAFLSLFTFSMLGLVVSTNLFQMYIFWELVGISSFLLIGFYYKKPSAIAAAKKAFIVTRFADLGFLIGILILSFGTQTLDFFILIDRLTQEGSVYINNFAGVTFMGLSLLSWALILVFVGGAGKSAMFPLHIWLPDAMEGPTPVSALIHAATMVVAGVFLVARLFPVFAISAPDALLVVAYTGIFTALFSAIIACSQTDIKRVLAYSTISQIGYMMFALGVAGWGKTQIEGYSASMFHLVTHAFFKALLFLGAGTIIHAVHSNDLKDMGGLRKSLPITHITFLIACLSIAGIPPLSGFFSKEAILSAAFQTHKTIFVLGLITSGITSFYMFRLYFRIFWFKPISSGSHNHEKGLWAITMPLIILAIGAAFAGFIPFGRFVSATGEFLHIPIHIAFSIAPVAIGLTGIAIASWFYYIENDLPQRTVKTLGSAYKWSYNKFYIDEIYIFITKKIIFNLIGRPAAWFDRNVVNGFINATAKGTAVFSEDIKGFQSGRLQAYTMYFLGGVILLSVILLLKFA